MGDNELGGVNRQPGRQFSRNQRPISDDDFHQAMVTRGVSGVCAGPGGRAHARTAEQFVAFLCLAIEAHKPSSETLLETNALAEGTHPRPHQPDSVRTRPRRLLSGRSLRQVGFEHGCGNAKVPDGQRARFHRQPRRPDAAKAGPRLQYRRRFGAQARVAKVLRGAIDLDIPAAGWHGQQARSRFGRTPGAIANTSVRHCRFCLRHRLRLRSRPPATLTRLLRHGLRRTLTVMPVGLLQCRQTCPPLTISSEQTHQPTDKEHL